MGENFKGIVLLTLLVVIISGAAIFCCRKFGVRPYCCCEREADR